MNTDINGHMMRSMRSENLWRKWARDFYIKGKPVSAIQKRYLKNDGTLYTKQYIYIKMAKVKEQVINS